MTLTLTKLDPSQAIVGSTDPITVTMTGSGFTEDTVLLWNGAEDVFHFVSETEGYTMIEMELVTVASVATVALTDGTDTTPELQFAFYEEGWQPDPAPDDSPGSPNTEAIPAEYMAPEPPDVYRQVALPESERTS